jgi:hypothetical protein
LGEERQASHLSSYPFLPRRSGAYPSGKHVAPGQGRAEGYRGHQQQPFVFAPAPRARARETPEGVGQVLNNGV